MTGGGSSRPARRADLWFGLLGGAAAWSLHLVTAYAVAEFGCVGGFGERAYLGIGVIAWLEAALTAATALVAALATASALRRFRRTRPGSVLEDDVASAERNAARAGLLTSGMFTFIILFESIPILFYLRGC